MNKVRLYYICKSIANRLTFYKAYKDSCRALTWGRRSRSPADSRLTERGENILDAALGRLADVDVDRVSRRLKRRELALEQRGGHVAVLAMPEPRADQVDVASQVDEAAVGESRGERLPVGFLQRGAGQYRFLLLPQLRIQVLQPGPAVCVGQRRAGGHFFDVGCGMKLVRVQESAIQARCEHFADGTLAGPGDAHHHDDHALLLTACPPNLARIMASSFLE